MQCVNCQFENTPGADHCARCHSALSLGDVAIAPPRATRWNLATWAARRWHGIVTAARALWDARPRWSGAVRTHVAWEAVAWSLIPGMGFIKFGNRLTGKLILFGWSVLMVLAILGLGRAAGSWCTAAAIFVHAMSMIAFLGTQLSLHSVMTRALVGMLIFLGLRYLLYAPLAALGCQFYVPLPIEGLAPGSVIQNDDALLYEGPWTRPARFNRGDIVVYDIGGGLYANHIMLRGLGLDRIIGVPGDRIDAREDGLYVNNQLVPPEAGPLGHANIQFGRDAKTLGADEYLVFPSRLNFTAYGRVDVDGFLNRMIRVPSADIRGRIVLRLHPWSRFGAIE